jgi:release factor glutamine methyltransferase
MEDDFPIEYKRGFTKFLNCKIDLRNRVFIPRIETEYWVGGVIKELKIENCKLKIKVLDIFAGSGCIGIAFLKNIKNSFLDFVDIDKKAIEQIKINLKLNKISPKRYKIYQSNLFEKINNKNYDYIFANPPYVAKERLAEVQESVRKFEPKISWYGGKEGLKYIKKFLKEAKKYLKKNGMIFIEIDPFQKENVEKILRKENYKKFKFCKDQFQKYRWLKIYGSN